MRILFKDTKSDTLKDIVSIKKICKNPDLVSSDSMSVTDISLALGISYTEAKLNLERGCLKIKKAIKELGLKEDFFEYYQDMNKKGIQND